jgi:hypothetical protein
MIWDRSFQQNRPCGCGELFHDCPTWNRIVSKAFGRLSAAEVASFYHDTRRLVRARYLLPLLMPWYRNRVLADVEEYLAALGRIYRSMASETGASLIVDNSKSAAYGLALGTIDGVDVYTLHLLRDPRGVAFSELRGKMHPDTNLPLGRRKPLGSAIGWNLANLSIEMLLKKPSRYLRVGYEQFTLDPAGVVDRVGAFVGEPLVRGADLELVGRRLHMQPTHTVFGNPDRFKTGTVPIRNDDAWKTELATGTRKLVEFVTWPMRRPYRDVLEGTMTVKRGQRAQSSASRPDTR